MKPADPDRVISAARAWLGTPYHDQASLKGVGCDCLGLARGVWREVIGPKPLPIPPYSLDWDEALDEAAAGLVEVQREHGKDALAVYLGNPAVHNHAVALYGPPFLRALRTRHRYSATSVDQLPQMLAAYLMFGHQLLLPIPDIDRAEYLLIIGANPLVSNGSIMSAPDMRRRLRELQGRGGQFTVVDPRRTETAQLADLHLFIRPGSDALRIKRYTGFASSVELAVRMFDNFDEAVIAGMWKFNKGTYDFQVLGGYARQDLVLGGGWAGNLGNAGLKGELTYFQPVRKDRDTAAFSATIGLDYSFSNSLYFNTGYLYNSSGSNNSSITGLFDFELSARNLYPYRHALFAQLSYPITPLLNGSAAFIYSPVEVHALFVNPVLTLSIKENWDIDLVGQIIMDKEVKGFTSPVQAAFLRLKYSY